MWCSRKKNWYHRFKYQICQHKILQQEEEERERMSVVLELKQNAKKPASSWNRIFPFPDCTFTSTNAATAINWNICHQVSLQITCKGLFAYYVSQIRGFRTPPPFSLWYPLSSFGSLSVFSAPLYSLMTNKYENKNYRRNSGGMLRKKKTKKKQTESEIS